VEIFQAVLDQDVPRARNTMRRHLRAVFEDIEQIRARSPELFSDSHSVPVRRNIVVWQ
jgi:DNA-binding GntR family transcriptional regulator